MLTESLLRGGPNFQPFLCYCLFNKSFFLLHAWWNWNKAVGQLQNCTGLIFFLLIGCYFHKGTTFPSAPLFWETYLMQRAFHDFLWQMLIMFIEKLQKERNYSEAVSFKYYHSIDIQGLSERRPRKLLGNSKLTEE